MSRAEELKQQIETLRDELAHVLMNTEKEKVKTVSCSVGALVNFLADIPPDTNLCFGKGDWGTHPVINSPEHVFYYYEKDGVLAINAIAPRGIASVALGETDMIYWRT